MNFYLYLKLYPSGIGVQLKFNKKDKFGPQQLTQPISFSFHHRLPDEIRYRTIVPPPFGSTENPSGSGQPLQQEWIRVISTPGN